MNHKKIIIFVLMTMIYIYALSTSIGFFICSSIYMFLLSLLFFNNNYEIKNLFTNLIFSLVFSFSIYYFFEKILIYPLP